MGQNKKIFIEQLENYYKYNPGLVQFFRDKGYQVALCHSEGPEKADPEQVDSSIAGCIAAIVCVERIDERRMDLAPDLKIIASCSAGTDHIDLSAAEERGIAVCNAAGGNAVSVAEMTIGSMISVARNAMLADRTMRRGVWRNYVGTELSGKTYGIMGTGMVGEEVARIACKGFGMKTLGYDVVERPGLAEKYGLEYVSREELFSRADFISIHIPLLPSTKGIVNMDLFKLMKKPSYLVNVSRGSVVDEDDLYEALKKGLISGVGMDVYDNEPNPDFRFTQFDNIINTCHMAGSTDTAIMRQGDSVTANIMAVLSGKEPLDNLVNPGYRRK